MNRTIRSLCAAVAAAAAFAAIPAQASASPYREPHPAAPAPGFARFEDRQPARGRFEDHEREYRELAAARERFYAARHSRQERERFERWHSTRRMELERRWDSRPGSFDRR